MKIFIWSHSGPRSNNHEIAEAVRRIHEEKGDSTYSFVSEDVLLTEDNIPEYQKELKSADMVYFVYPIHWGSYPHKMKEAIDRLLTYGFAYEYSDDGQPIPLLTGKVAKIITSSGHPNEYYGNHLESIHSLAEKTILGFVGMKVLGAFNAGGRKHGKIEGLLNKEILDFIKK